MPVTINGTTGITTPAENTAALTVGSITGILKATSGVVSQAVAGTDYLTSTSGGGITLATAQTASGTSVDFTGIPSWAKRITVMFSGVSTSGTSALLVQIGTGSTTYTTSGYVGVCASAGASGLGFSAGFIVSGDVTVAAQIYSGLVTICNVTGNTWAENSVLSPSATAQSGPRVGSGYVPLSATLTAVRITTVNGTDTFDAGSINISYE